MGRAKTSKTSTIQELNGLKWEDVYFEGDKDVLAVFDFDYPAIEEFQTQVITATLLCPLIGIPSMLCCVPCTCKQNIHWQTYALHVAVSQDGIRYVTEKRKAGCGFDFQDVGKQSKTVPFDKITDCDVTEPAGATCFCITNVLSQLNVDTASGARTGGEGGPTHELSLAGLKRPNEMKALVWAMKRHQAGGGAAIMAQQQIPTSSGEAPSMMAAMDRGDGETNEILREIRDELRELNTHLREKG